MSGVVLAEREPNLEFYIPTTPFKTSSYLPRRETVIINRSMILREFLSVFFSIPRTESLRLTFKLCCF